MVAKGSPWNMTACVYLTDHLTTPSGERVYENSVMLYAKGRWGKIVEQGLSVPEPDRSPCVLPRSSSHP